MQNEKVPGVSREQVRAVEDAFNDTRISGERFFAELSMPERVRMVEVAVRFAAHRLASTTAQSEAVQKLVEAAEDNAWREARELVRGTNADLCKTGEQAYRIIQKGITDAANNRSLRTLKGRVAAHHESQP